jgi:hypothetical protein
MKEAAKPRRPYSLNLHVRRLTADFWRKLSRLIFQIGGDPHEFGRQIRIGGSLRHFEQRRCRLARMEAILRHSITRRAKFYLHK